MDKTNTNQSSRPVAIWLLVGVAMIIIQILLGGITRLTGSGLSITEWKPIMGTLPPMNDQDWSLAFEKYQRIAQFKYVNSHFTLEDFKFIYFWEWLHRLWARLIGLAFLIPFIIFLVQRRFKPGMIKPMIILFLLGALQGLVGWIMVQSGLSDSDRLYVSHYKLAIHFILALALLCYVIWFAFSLLIKEEQFTFSIPLRKMTFWFLSILVIQLIYGAFMAGLKAAAAAPTWPSINGEWLSGPITSLGNREFSGISFLSDNPLVVQFIHRILAYLIMILAIIWWLRVRKIKGTKLFEKTRVLPVVAVLVQVGLGVLTVLNALNNEYFLWLGIAHQFMAMILLLIMVWMLYIIRKSPSLVS